MLFDVLVLAVFLRRKVLVDKSTQRNKFLVYI